MYEKDKLIPKLCVTWTINYLIHNLGINLSFLYTDKGKYGWLEVAFGIFCLGKTCCSGMIWLAAWFYQYNAINSAPCIDTIRQYPPLRIGIPKLTWICENSTIDDKLWMYLCPTMAENLNASWCKKLTIILKFLKSTNLYNSEHTRQLNVSVPRA